MSLTSLNQGAISFKKVSGKSHTNQTFAVSEEGIITNIQSSAETIFAQSIEPLPVTNSGLTSLYSTNGTIQRIKFPIDIIPNTQIGVNQSQGYRLKLPADWNTHPGALYPKFTTGTYLHVALGKLQIVPSLYGTLKVDGSTEYDPILYQTNGSTVITKFDAINWYFDPYSGVLFVQDPPAGFDISASRPGFLEAFLYVGDYMSDVLNIIATGATGTTGLNVGSGVGIFKNKIGNDLRFKSLIGGSNISITGSTNNVIISFTGSSGGGTITGATNGLSQSGNNLQLGGNYGTVNLNSIGNASGFAINMGGDSSYTFINSIHGNGNGVIGVVNGSSSFPNSVGVSLQAGTSSGNQASFYIDLDGHATGEPAGAKFLDQRSGTTSVGIEYAADYSANFTDRSLVDKGWVLSQIITGSTGSNIRTITGNTTLNSNDQLVLVNTSLTAITVTLPNPITLKDGQIFIIKDKSANALLKNITITGNTINIDSTSFFIINTNNGSVTMAYSKTDNQFYITAIVAAVSGGTFDSTFDYTFS